MRLVPILSALFAGAVIYGFVLERDTLRALAGGETAAPEVVPAAAAADSDAAVPVVVMRSEAQPAETGLIVRGRTEAARIVSVLAETTGLVSSQPLRAGTSVEAGDLLCSIDPGGRPALLAEAEARLLEAEANERASAALAERGFTAETAAIANRAALQAAQALVQQARLEIDRLEIHAPFDGVLETDTAELGTLLQPGSECATVLALDPIKLTGYVSETNVGALVVGAPVGARLLSGEMLAGRITFVARAADEATRTFRIEAEAPNPDGRIRAGITAEILVAVAGDLGHLLPQSALTLDDSGRLGIRAAVDGTARFMAVELLRDTSQGVWVGGLPEVVDVIVVGQDYVTDGQAVTATLREAQP
jgi:multidrug efflux system membrane fusion protein